MERTTIQVPESFVAIFGKDAENVISEMIKKKGEKLKIVEKISKMSLPVDDWDVMEKEIIEGAIE